jgi:hypothetical protein
VVKADIIILGLHIRASVRCCRLRPAWTFLAIACFPHIDGCVRRRPSEPSADCAPRRGLVHEERYPSTGGVNHGRVGWAMRSMLTRMGCGERWCGTWLLDFEMEFRWRTSSAERDGLNMAVIRGGSWNNNPQNLQSANRNNNKPTNRNNNNEFRCAKTLYGRNPGRSFLGGGSGECVTRSLSVCSRAEGACVSSAK